MSFSSMGARWRQLALLALLCSLWPAARAGTPGLDLPPLAQPPRALVLPVLHEQVLANGLKLVVAPRPALLGSQPIPLHGLRLVLHHALSVGVAKPEVVLGKGISFFGVLAPLRNHLNWQTEPRARQEIHSKRIQGSN